VLGAVLGGVLLAGLCTGQASQRRPTGWGVGPGGPGPAGARDDPGVVGVVVVDDEALVRSCLRAVLDAAEGVEVLACATGVDAAGVVAASRPEVVLLDVRMPVVDGLAVLPQLVALPQPPAVAMLTSFDADEHVQEALARGAAGFLLKDTPPEQLVASVLALAAGAVVLSPGAAGALLVRRGAGSAGAQAQVASLTVREREVLALLGQGLSNAEVGRRLGMRSSTAKDHVSAVLGKLGVTSRVQAALVARQAGLDDGWSGVG